MSMLSLRILARPIKLHMTVPSVVLATGMPIEDIYLIESQDGLCQRTRFFTFSVCDKRRHNIITGGGLNRFYGKICVFLLVQIPEKAGMFEADFLL